MTKKSGILVAMLLLTSTQYSLAQKAKFQSIFIYNFSKYVKWPDSHSGDSFVIGVYGGGEVKASLSEMASVKKEIHGMSIEVVGFDAPNGIDRCHILFIPGEHCDQLEAVKASVTGKPVLIVTDKPGMAEKGSAINFVEKDGKIKFELNQAVTERQGLKVAGSLASLAILI